MSKIKATKKNCSVFNEETLSTNFILRAMKNNPKEFLENESLSLILLFPNKNNSLIRILHNIYTTNLKFNIFKDPMTGSFGNNGGNIKDIFNNLTTQELEEFTSLSRSWIRYSRRKDTIKNAYFAAYVLNEAQDYNLRLLALSRISNQQIRKKLINYTNLYFDLDDYLKNKVHYAVIDGKEICFKMNSICDYYFTKEEEDIKYKKLTQYLVSCTKNIPYHSEIEYLLDLGECFNTREESLEILIKNNEAIHENLKRIFDASQEDSNLSEKEKYISFHNVLRNFYIEKYPYVDITTNFQNKIFIYRMEYEDKLLNKYINRINNKEISLDEFFRIVFKGGNIHSSIKSYLIKNSGYTFILPILYRKGLNPEIFNEICIRIIKILLYDIYMKNISINSYDFEKLFDLKNSSYQLLERWIEAYNNLAINSSIDILSWQFAKSIKKESEFKILFKDLEIIRKIRSCARRRNINLNTVRTPGRYELELESESKKILINW